MRFSIKLCNFGTLSIQKELFDTDMVQINKKYSTDDKIIIDLSTEEGKELLKKLRKESS